MNSFYLQVQIKKKKTRNNVVDRCGIVSDRSEASRTDFVNAKKWKIVNNTIIVNYPVVCCCFFPHFTLRTWCGTAANKTTHFSLLFYFSCGRTTPQWIVETGSWPARAYITWKFSDFFFFFASKWLGVTYSLSAVCGRKCVNYDLMLRKDSKCR